MTTTKQSFDTDRAAIVTTDRDAIVADLQRLDAAVIDAYRASKELYNRGEQMDIEIYNIAEKHGIDLEEYRPLGRSTKRD